MSYKVESNNPTKDIFPWPTTRLDDVTRMVWSVLFDPPVIVSMALALAFQNAFLEYGITLDYNIILRQIQLLHYSIDGCVIMDVYFNIVILVIMLD